MKRGPSVWADALPEPQRSFPGGRVRADVAIVGGGLTGLSAALHVLDRWPGARVVVLEATRLGAGASGRSSGMVSPGVGQSLVALVRRFGKERARALYSATLRAVRDLESLVAREGIDCELEMSGQLIVARDPGSRRRLDAIAELMTELELPAERVDCAFAESALRLPVAGTLHPGKLVRGLGERVLERGGIVYEGARVRSVGQRLVLDDGEVLVDRVVMATAAYTAELGVFRGRVLPVHLQALVTEPLSEEQLARLGFRREGVIDARRIFDYFRLTRDGRIVFGGGSPRYRWAGRTDEDCSERALERLAIEFARIFPGIAIDRGWTGVVDYVVDAIPAIERSADDPALVHAVGWCGHGIALSVAAGAWITRILADEESPEALPWFRDRPPLVPFEAVRWTGFRASVGVMAALDRLS